MSRMIRARFSKGVIEPYSTNPDGNKEGLEGFLTSANVLGMHEEICRIFGKERGRLRRQKQLIGDIRHYEMVGGLKIFSL